MSQSGVIESLLKAARSSAEGDTSVNLSKRSFPSASAAIAMFHTARTRIRNILEWSENSNATSYALFNRNGEQVDHEPVGIGHFIRINLYGGGKYDWVQVVGIADEPDEFVLTVKPTYDPTGEPVDRDSISHFFGPE